MKVTGLDRRPILVAIAGPNGAGKTTFYNANIAPAAIPLVNADIFAQQLKLDPYLAAKLADSVRRMHVKARESFAFETVFSDPNGEKLKFLEEAAASGYTVILCFVGLANPKLSEQRVAMRVSQGGHDVPAEKLHARYPRTLKNLKAALQSLPLVYVFDNSNLSRPFQELAVYQAGKALRRAKTLPRWIKTVL